MPLRLLVCAGLVACALVAHGAAGASPRFAPRVDNPWFPLTPGTTYVYRGTEDGRPTRDVVAVTRRTKTIRDARCTVVEDRLYVAGRLAERTSDWYAQDRGGTVWYFGEATAEIGADGKVASTEGSWEAGVDGAREGVFMPTRPRVGRSFRQEHYPGHAEDRFRVESLAARVDTPFVRSRRALRTREWTPLEPGVLSDKLYVRGLGLVAEASVKGGRERSELVAVRRA